MKPTRPEFTTSLILATYGTYPTVVRREIMDSSQSIHTEVTVTLLEVIDLKVRVIIRPMVDLLLLCEVKLGFFSKITHINESITRFFSFN
jgi:hypothetical protein